MSSPSEAGLRFVGLDVHKRYVVVAAVDEGQHVILNPRRIELDCFGKWASGNLYPTDVVVLEATSSAWDMYDQLRPLVGVVLVANPAKVALIAKSRVKTDAKDVLVLAGLLAAGLIPTVWVPPADVRELRGLVAHRQRLVWQRIRTRGRLRAVLLRHNLVAPSGDAFSGVNREWWRGLPLSSTEQLRVRQDLTMLDALVPLVTEVEKEIAACSQHQQWGRPGGLSRPAARDWVAERDGVVGRHRRCPAVRECTSSGWIRWPRRQRARFWPNTLRRTYHQAGPTRHSYHQVGRNAPCLDRCWYFVQASSVRGRRKTTPAAIGNCRLVAHVRGGYFGGHDREALSTDAEWSIDRRAHLFDWTALGKWHPNSMPACSRRQTRTGGMVGLACAGQVLALMACPAAQPSSRAASADGAPLAWVLWLSASPPRAVRLGTRQDMAMLRHSAIKGV